MIMLSQQHSFTSERGGPKIETFFKELSFTPSFPNENDLVKAYGAGSSIVKSGYRYHCYYSKSKKVWVALRVSAEDKIESPVTGIIVTILPLTKKVVPPDKEIPEVSVKGIYLRDKENKIKNVFGEPLREYVSNLGENINLKVLEYFPNNLTDGSCIRFYIKEEIVVGFSFSSEV